MKVATLVLVSASVAMGAAVEEKQLPGATDVVEAEHAIETSPELNRIIRKGQSITRGRSFIDTMSERIMSFFGYGDGDDYGDYGGDEYYYPDGPEGHGSSYAFYQPYGNYQPARDDNFEEEDAYGFGDFMFDAAIVAVPMALVLVAMPTGLFTIPIVGRSMQNSVVDNLREFEMPVLKAIEKADFLSYTTRDCQERIFCEVSKIGRSKDASVLQKMFYIAANMTPDPYAESYGLKKVFKASRDAQCEMFKCVPLMTPGGVFSKKAQKVAKLEQAL